MAGREGSYAPALPPPARPCHLAHVAASAGAVRTRPSLSPVSRFAPNELPLPMGVVCSRLLLRSRTAVDAPAPVRRLRHRRLRRDQSLDRCHRLRACGGGRVLFSGGSGGAAGGKGAAAVDSRQLACRRREACGPHRQALNATQCRGAPGLAPVLRLGLLPPHHPSLRRPIPIRARGGWPAPAADVTLSDRTRGGGMIAAGRWYVGPPRTLRFQEGR